MPEISKELHAKARAIVDAAEAECVAKGWVYCFGTGNAKETLDKHIAEGLAASASSSEPEEWLPIASAPKDGTRILLAKIVGHPDHPTALWWATLGHWSAKWNNWNDGIEPSGLADPTHWLPASGHGVGPSSRHSDGERSR